MKKKSLNIKNVKVSLWNERFLHLLCYLFTGSQEALKKGR